MGKIEVEGYAERTVDYDLMEITIGFCRFEKVAEDASKKVMDDCEKFLSVLKNLGFDTSEIRLKEDSVRPDKDYYGFDENSEDGYRASRELELTTVFDMKMINVLRSIVNNNNLSASFGVDYKLSNTADIRKELGIQAIKNAKTQAELIAGSLDMKVKGLISANKNKTRDFDIEPLMCLAESEAYLCDCEEEYECTDELKSTTKTLSETIYTEWEVIADE